MQKNELLLKEKSLLKSMIILFIPAIISVIISQSSFIVDSLFVTKYNIRMLQILTLEQPLNMFVSMIIFIILAGSIPLITRLLGSGNKEKAREYYMSTLLIISILTITYILIIFIGNDYIFTNILSIPNNLLSESKSYIYPIIISHYFLGVNMTIESIAISQGENYKIMIINFISLLINIIFNFLSLYILNLGIFGVGLATLLSQFIKFLIYLFFMNTSNIYFIKKFTIDSEYTSIVIKMAVASFGMSFFSILAQLISNKYISLENTATHLLIVKSMVTICFNFSTAFMIGIMQTSQSFIAYNYGAKNYIRMKNSIIISILSSLSIASIVSIIFITSQNNIANFFALSPNDVVFKLAIYSVSISLYSMPITFLVTIISRSLNQNKVLYYHQWFTNGFILLMASILYPLIFSNIVLPSIMPLSQITMLIFSIPSYYFLLKYIYKLCNKKNN